MTDFWTKPLSECAPPPIGPIDWRHLTFFPINFSKMSKPLDDRGHPLNDAFAVAFALWNIAWGQVPAGSLPNDRDAIIALLDEFHTEIPGDNPNLLIQAMYGFNLHDDNRWYHSFIVKIAQLDWDDPDTFMDTSLSD